MSQEQRATLDAVLRSSEFDIGGDLALQRKVFSDMVAAHPLPDDVAIEPSTMSGVPVLDIRPPGAKTDKTVFYLHGGAYTIGSAADGAGLAADIAGRTGYHALSVDYRLAPEHPFPSAIDDTLAVYRALIEGGKSSGDISVVGESAGGGLAVATVLAARDAGLPLPASVTVFSPFTDLTFSGRSLTGKAAVDPALTAAGLKIRAAEYLAGADAHSPLASPVFADLTGFPPLLIQAGGNEILLDDATRLAARAAENGVAVTLQVYPGVPHVFQGFAAMLDEGAIALDRAADFITHAWA
ncbi:alpha/beta hydrolase [Lentzea sp. NBC_00516]|uniref:alpha/beta hydrolase n=1 Tax=Lentzea sp. NBC_00516 TaxID=2903582 RepID=UPI002E8189FA|nr:alpha/beta hydrolase [Lentzea sp. NBC_00516]WUD28051.1 alpha/beta hydrolase [Lentzea sp. NBC_00516]